MLQKFISYPTESSDIMDVLIVNYDSIKVTRNHILPAKLFKKLEEYLNLNTEDDYGSYAPEKDSYSKVEISSIPKHEICYFSSEESADIFNICINMRNGSAIQFYFSHKHELDKAYEYLTQWHLSNKIFTFLAN